MNIPEEVSTILEKIYEATSPVSIFVYGSQARGDDTSNSDFEIGILYKKDKRVSRSDLAKMHDTEGLNINPFVYEDFIAYQLDTPFPLAFYLRSLFGGGAKTMYGEEVVENIAPPRIMLSDMLEEISFQIAYALGALLSIRQKDTITAKEQLVKAIMYGSRAFLALNGEFVHKYNEIVDKTISSDLKDEYKELLSYAMRLREDEEDVMTEMIFTTISFLNQVVRRQIKERFNQANTIVLDGAELK